MRPLMENPEWIDSSEYPFKPKYFRCEAGDLHYVDEGSGDPLVMVHGNPDWSFSYRKLIKAISSTHRCVALDHIGFGLSDKPIGWTYLPKDHAANFAALMESLALENITLVVNDWGGPIALSYAISHPEKIRRIVLLNTWLWPVKDDWYFRGFSGFMGGPIGKFLIKRHNFFAKVVLKKAYSDKRRLTKKIHQHYLKPLENSADRKGNWVFPKEIIGSSEWLADLWSKVSRIKDKPSLILWGLRDIAFREKELATWEKTLTHYQLHTFKDAGHYPHEEKSDEVVRLIADFLKD